MMATLHGTGEGASRLASTRWPSWCRCVALLVIVGSLGGCDREPSDWSKATTQNTADAYESYLKEHAAGPHVAEAKQLLAERQEDRAWSKAKTSNTASAYRGFLDCFPQSVSALMAEEALLSSDPPSGAAEHDYQAAASVDMRHAYEAFARSHPHCALAYTARRQLRRFTTLTANDDMLIPISELRDRYHFDSKCILWGPQGPAYISLPGGSMMFLSKNTADPRYGVPFTFGFSGEGNGLMCAGNLELSGRYAFPEAGLRLYKGSTLTYRTQDAFPLAVLRDRAPTTTSQPSEGGK